MAARGRVGAGKDRTNQDLEEGNDGALDALAERVGLLKSVTQGIRNEADSQHTVLDRLGLGFASTHSVLGAANDKFKMVMSNKQNRSITLVIVGFVLLLGMYWYFTQ